jgi:hypothetical protein
LNPLHPGGTQAVCLIASDLSAVKRAERELRASSAIAKSCGALLSVREEDGQDRREITTSWASR